MVVLENDVFWVGFEVVLGGQVVLLLEFRGWVWVVGALFLKVFWFLRWLGLMLLWTKGLGGCFVTIFKVFSSYLKVGDEVMLVNK